MLAIKKISMEFSFKFSKYRRVASWLLEKEDSKIYLGDIEGENLSGVWRLSRVKEGGTRKPILTQKLRYLDEEIISALNKGQKARLAFLTYMYYIWRKKFLHLSL